MRSIRHVKSFSFFFLSATCLLAMEKGKGRQLFFLLIQLSCKSLRETASSNNVSLSLKRGKKRKQFFPFLNSGLYVVENKQIYIYIYINMYITTLLLLMEL